VQVSVAEDGCPTPAVPADGLFCAPAFLMTFASVFILPGAQM